MHCWKVSPGFWLVTLYIAALESLSPSTTVPAAIALPLLVVVALNAE